MNAKHTPGPWRANLVTGEITHAFGKLKGHASLVLAKVTIRASRRDEQEANARLIAAAPELLEALRNLIEGYESCTHTGTMDMQVVGADVIAAVAAIAKATGE